MYGHPRSADLRTDAPRHVRDLPAVVCGSLLLARSSPARTPPPPSRPLAAHNCACGSPALSLAAFYTGTPAMLTEPGAPHSAAPAEDPLDASELSPNPWLRTHPIDAAAPRGPSREAAARAPPNNTRRHVRPRSQAPTSTVRKVLDGTPFASSFTSRTS